MNAAGSCMGTGAMVHVEQMHPCIGEGSDSRTKVGSLDERKVVVWVTSTSSFSLSSNIGCPPRTASHPHMPVPTRAAARDAATEDAVRGCSARPRGAGGMEALVGEGVA